MDAESTQKHPGDTEHGELSEQRELRFAGSSESCKSNTALSEAGAYDTRAHFEFS